MASSYLQYPLRIWGAAFVGLMAGIIIGTTSDYFTSEDKIPVKKTAEASQTGTAVNIITGFSYGLTSVFPPLIGIGVASAIAYKLCEPLGEKTNISGGITTTWEGYKIIEGFVNDLTIGSGKLHENLWKAMMGVGALAASIIKTS
ncbi:MAG: sodium/proton-translocating pyrophosphatase, partial [candidate division WOR-3 bacterium]